MKSTGGWVNIQMDKDFSKLQYNSFRKTGTGHFISSVN